MKKRYRKTLLDEYQAYSGLCEHPYAADFREQVGDFVITHIQENGKVPSHKEIVDACISEKELRELDVMRETYNQLISGNISDSCYTSKLKELLDC